MNNPISPTRPTSPSKQSDPTRPTSSPKQSGPSGHQSESLSGAIERVTFHSEDSGFCVLKVKAKGHRELVTVIGAAQSVTPGEYIDCLGNWVTNREYGLQFQAKELRMVMPATREGIEKYLGSGLVKGVGPHFAKKLVQAFGENVFEIIENSPDKLSQVSGIGEYRSAKIIHSWQEQKVIRNIMVFLQSHGVGTARAVRIYKTYGKDAIERVRENPYRLALDIHGIGFKTADALAERLGVSKESMMRAQAGIKHVLQELCNLGHCAVLEETLLKESIELLEIPESTLKEAIQVEGLEKRLILEERGGQIFVFLAALYRAELGVVEHLKRLLSFTASWQKKINLEKALADVQTKTKLELSLGQRTALRSALKHKVVIITGGPGVGKTTLVNSLLTIVNAYTDNILLCAPTGRAAKRLSDSTKFEAKTLHRLLEFDPKKYTFKRNETLPLEADLLVVDELSMVDLNMMNQLLRAIPSECVLVLVGDQDQLPSVGPGSVLADLIQSERIPTIALTEIFRQAQNSKIIMNAHKINKGHLPELGANSGEISDFYFIEANTEEEIQEKLFKVVSDRIPHRFGFDPVREVQVLVPMNRGGLGVRALNLELQKLLNPNFQKAQQEKKTVTRYGWTYSIGDKVIQTVNDYDKEVFNGDIGFIKSIDVEESQLKIEFEGRLVNYELEELDEISLAYATTVHKAQGSEYKAVVIPIAMQHFMLLERNLLYTAVTRGKSLVVLIGQRKAVGMAVRTVRSGKRITHLAERLSEGIKV